MGDHIKFFFPMQLECITPNLQVIQKMVRTIDQYIISLCPYCREVILGKPDEGWISSFGGKFGSVPSGFILEF